MREGDLGREDEVRVVFGVSGERRESGRRVGLGWVWNGRRLAKIEVAVETKV